MQTFDSFHTVYGFFLRVDLEPEYVEQIDREYESGSCSKEIKQLIQDVKTFHLLRTRLCNTIKEHLKHTPMLNDLASASGLDQYDTVPEKSTCFISDQTMSKRDGLLLLIDGVRPYTVHKRYKILLYNFWILVHFPKEIARESRNWLNTQLVHNRNLKSVSERVGFITNYQQKLFPKKMYLKLKGIAQYIQREFPSVPINQSRRNKG